MKYVDSAPPELIQLAYRKRNINSNDPFLPRLERLLTVEGTPAVKATDTVKEVDAVKGMNEVWTKLRELGMVDLKQEKDGGYIFLRVGSPKQDPTAPIYKHKGVPGEMVLPHFGDYKTPSALWHQIEELEKARAQGKLKSAAKNIEAIGEIEKAANTLISLINKHDLDRFQEEIDQRLNSKIHADWALENMIEEKQATDDGEEWDEHQIKAFNEYADSFYKEAVESFKRDHPIDQLESFPHFHPTVTGCIKEYINVLQDPKTVFRLTSAVYEKPSDTFLCAELALFMLKVYRKPLYEYVGVIVGAINDRPAIPAKRVEKYCRESGLSKG